MSSEGVLLHRNANVIHCTQKKGPVPKIMEAEITRLLKVGIGQMAHGKSLPIPIDLREVDTALVYRCFALFSPPQIPLSVRPKSIRVGSFLVGALRLPYCFGTGNAFWSLVGDGPPERTTNNHAMSEEPTGQPRKPK